MDMIQSAEAVALFCRLHMNQKRELPIRASEMGLLIFIVKNPDEPTPLKAARFFQISKPMVTAMVRVLEKKGYITKNPSRQDGRSFTLLPTEKALAMVEQTYQEYTRRIESLCAAMGAEDFDRLIRLIEKANGILGEEKAYG
jgi:DNA-binding MarR family transcriptional regulator